MSTDMWQCPDCSTAVHRHPDPEHESQAWTEQLISQHETLHAAQLAEHDGDREALRRRLRYPGLHAAIQKTQGKGHR